MSGSDWVHLDVLEIIGETDKAFKLLLEGGEEVWVAKSQVRVADEYEKGDRNCSVSITAWMARQKNLG